MCRGNVIVAKESVKYLGTTLGQDMAGNNMGMAAIKKIKKVSSLCTENLNSLTQSVGKCYVRPCYNLTLIMHEMFGTEVKTN